MATQQHKSVALPLALAYAALIVYASLYPFADWRDQGIAPWAYLAAPWPRYWTAFDFGINVVGYMPLGFLAAIYLTWGGLTQSIDLYIFGVLYIITGFGVTVGYHRLFTHRSFSAPAPV